MNKQAFSSSLALALIVGTYLVCTPMRVIAGSTGIIGGGEDSSSSSGDTFSPGTSTPSQPAPDVNVEVGSDGGFSTSIEVQSSLNEAIANIINQTPPPNSATANILAILQEATNAAQLINQLQTSLTNLGVRASSVRSLFTALTRLFGSQSASATGVGGNTKSLIANLEIAQKEASPSVDINQLNAAITAYNTIVMESSPEVLRQLAKDPEFREIGKVLKQLRAALSSK